MAKPYFSLLHATYNSEATLSDHYEKWLDACEYPADVEYIFALERGDLNETKVTAGFKVVITDPKGGLSSAILNWNSAAESASGKVLFVVSDDLDPIRHWDSHLKSAIGDAEPTAQRFVIKINDSNDSGDSLVRHPIVSRKHYQDLGLFNPRFSSMYADNDFTWRAFFRSKILDARQLVFLHKHPSAGRFPETASQRRNNRQIEFLLGKSLFQDFWPSFISPAKAKSLPLCTSHRSPTLVINFERSRVIYQSVKQHLLSMLSKHKS